MQVRLKLAPRFHVSLSVCDRYAAFLTITGLHAALSNTDPPFLCWCLQRRLSGAAMPLTRGKKPASSAVSKIPKLTANTTENQVTGPATAEPLLVQNPRSALHVT